MFSQFEDMLLAPLVKKLNEHGVNVDAETIKHAVSNSPQVVAQIEAVLLTGTTQEKAQKVLAILNQATQGGASAATVTTNTTTNTSNQGK